MKIFKMKVKLLDKKLLTEFKKKVSIISSILSLVLIFIPIPNGYGIVFGLVFLIILSLLYLIIFFNSNRLREIKINIGNSNVTVKFGDLFKEKGLKVITFNEYLDTEVNDKIIARSSINGKFLTDILPKLNTSIDAFNDCIDKRCNFKNDDILEWDEQRNLGKKQKYKIGTTVVFDDYIITAFTKFDKNNCAHLTMPEYVDFLMRFWCNINKVYAEKIVNVPILGAGLTRISENSTIKEEELLLIMLWTFNLSKSEIKSLNIIIDNKLIDKVNLFRIASSDACSA